MFNNNTYTNTHSVRTARGEDHLLKFQLYKIKALHPPGFLAQWVQWRYNYMQAIQCSLYMALGCYLSRKNSRLSISPSLSLFQSLTADVQAYVHFLCALCTAEPSLLKETDLCWLAKMRYCEFLRSNRRERGRDKIDEILHQTRNVQTQSRKEIEEKSPAIVHSFETRLKVQGICCI